MLPSSKVYYNYISDSVTKLTMTLIKDCTESYMAKNYNLCLVAKLDEGTEELKS